jgi:hypothetical protein
MYPVAASHAGGTTLVATSPTFEYHVGDESPTFAYDIDNIPSTFLNDIRGIEKPKHLRHEPRLLCRTCEGSYLTHLCPSTARIPEVWGSPKGPSNYEVSMVSPHLVPPIDTTVTLLQSSLDHTPIFEGDASFSHVIIIPDPTPFELEIFILSPSDLPPSPEEVPFDRDGLLAYPTHQPISFLVRDII